MMIDNIVELRNKLIEARKLIKKVYGSYELDDQIYSLIETTEYDLDEFGVDYE